MASYDLTMKDQWWIYHPYSVSNNASVLKEAEDFLSIPRMHSGRGLV